MINAKKSIKHSHIATCKNVSVIEFLIKICRNLPKVGRETPLGKKWQNESHKLLLQTIFHLIPVNINHVENSQKWLWTSFFAYQPKSSHEIL